MSRRSFAFHHLSASTSMKLLPNLACHLLPWGLGLLSAAHAQDVYTEANFPTPLLLKPGITQVSGGITSAGQADRFYYRDTFPGNVTVSLRYQHRNANPILGITELPPLSGALVSGLYSPPDTFHEFEFWPDATLDSPFFIIGGENTIAATVPTLNDFAGTAQLSVTAPAGKTHPNFTVEFNYQPTRDPWETGGGNDTAQTAFALDPVNPGTLKGGTHGAADADWFRFTVPPGRSLRLSIVSDVISTPLGIQPHQCILHNALSIPLQNATSGAASFIENAGPSGQTFLLRITSQDAYAQKWTMSWALEDALEPNDSLAQAYALGTLLPQGRIEIPGLTLLGRDYYTVKSGLPAGTPILIAALPDPMKSIDGRVSVLIAGGTITSNTFRNYRVVTTGENGVISIYVDGSPSSYRLLIKPQSAYDVWQQTIAEEEYTTPSYVPAASDFDADGLPAALEWALRLSPFIADRGVIPPPYFDGSSWRVNLPMPQGGAAADILASESDNLENWTDFPAVRNNLGGSIIPAGRTAGAVFTLTRPGAAKNFLRFGVQD